MFSCYYSLPDNTIIKGTCPDNQSLPITQVNFDQCPSIPLLTPSRSLDSTSRKQEFIKQLAKQQQSPPALFNHLSFPSLMQPTRKIGTLRPNYGTGYAFQGRLYTGVKKLSWWYF